MTFPQAFPRSLSRSFFKAGFWNGRSETIEKWPVRLYNTKIRVSRLESSSIFSFLNSFDCVCNSCEKLGFRRIFSKGISVVVNKNSQSKHRSRSIVTKGLHNGRTSPDQSARLTLPINLRLDYISRATETLITSRANTLSNR